MLQQLRALSGGLRAAAGGQQGLVLPALARQARCYGFGSHMSDNDPELMEKEKQRQLKGKTVSHIKEVPGWSERLASDAEAVVKAERDCPDCSMDEMQRQTVETLQAEAEADDLNTTNAEPKSGGIGGV